MKNQNNIIKLNDFEEIAGKLCGQECCTVTTEINGNEQLLFDAEDVCKILNFDPNTVINKLSDKQKFLVESPKEEGPVCQFINEEGLGECLSMKYLFIF